MAPLSLASFLITIVIIVIAQSNPGGANPFSLQESDDAATSASVTGLLYGLEPGRGRGHKRLDRQDVKSIAKDEKRYIRLYLDDGSPPFDMLLTQRSVWTRKSLVFVRRGKYRTQVPHGLTTDCYLHGRLISRDGAVTMNRCGRMSGKILVSGHQFVLEEESWEGSAPFSFKVTKKIADSFVYYDQRRKKTKNFMEERETFDRRKRHGSLGKGALRSSFPSDALDKTPETKEVTIEVGIFADANFMTRLSSKGVNSTEKAVDWFVSKWNMIQDVYSNVKTVGFKANIELKRIELWWRNPTKYPENKIMEDERLLWFCENTPEDGDVDQKVLYTSYTGGQRVGLSYVGATCDVHRNCYLVKSPKDSIYIELHEMGHSLGLRHDPFMENCERPGGFMGWKRSSLFLDCYRQKLLKLIGDYDCLYNEKT